MRTRALLAAAATALLVPALPPASAGTGSASSCAGGVEVLGWPVTAAVLVVGAEPGSTYREVRVCFSDTPPGATSAVTGGSVALRVRTETGGATPGAFAEVECVPDLGATGVFPVCYEPVGANVVPGETRVETPPGSTCLVGLDGTCEAYVPVWSSTPTATRPARCSASTSSASRRAGACRRSASRS
ncbi:MAG TPA: hypothetical protein VFQ85_17095 [Mycobacteriales bacterium]|jgi:hypothetical protein|nr:hypothetical protein [Mycobacteriales bacterium]